MWHPRRLTDKGEILAFLEQDRLYAAYAIGDLEAGPFELSDWAGAVRGDRLETLALHYRGLDPPVLFLMGEPDGLPAILRMILRPRRVYLTCLQEHWPAIRAFYRADPPQVMWRMVLRPADFRPVSHPDVVPLGPIAVPQLEQLYALGGADAFSPTQVATGVFYGVRLHGRLVSAAGTHLVSPTYRVAAVGNVFTAPEYRGRGYATAATSAVVAELLKRGIQDVVLNVARDNAPAIRIYRRLGFREHCLFLEGLAVRR
ncbi:MAG TPA: GNAT family N-acetyltransferase [Chloroflexi bacterium]|nr:GNAT family N-acetyltransferase [Chloroflexota bacterium]